MDTTLKFVIEADASGMVRVTQQAGDALQVMGQKAEQAGKTASDSFAASMKDFGSKATAAGATLTAAFTLPIVGAGAAAIKTAGDFEQTGIAFNTMLGSAEKATAFLKDLEAFAARTPFEFNDLTAAAKKMMALGFSAEQVIPTLTSIGDAVAGLGGGSEMINRVTLALGQMQAKGKVSAQEMNQLAENGIPAWDLLAKKIGVSIPEAMSLAEKGAVSASVAVPAILEGMMTKFGGMMEKQSQTFLGQISNMRDQLFFTLRDLGTSLLPVANTILENVIKPAVSGLKMLAEGFANLPEPIQTVLLVVGGLAAAIGPLLVVFGTMATGISTLLPMFPMLAAGIKTATLALGPWGIALTAVAALIVIFSDEIADATIKVGEYLGVIDKMPGVAQASSGAHDRIAQALKVSNETLDKLISSNKNALLIFGQHKTAIEQLQAKVAAGKMTQSEYEAELRKMIGTTGKATETVESNIAAQIKAAASAEKLKSEMAALRSETEKSLNPAEELASKIRKQIDVGFSKHQIIALHRDEIIKATEKQLAMTGQVSEATAALYEMAVEMESQKNRTIPDYGGAVIDMTAKLGNMGASLGEIKTKFDDLPLTVSKDRMIDVVNEAGNVDERFKHLASDQGGLQKSKEKMTEFGQTVSTTLTNMTQEIADKVTGWAGPFQDFASAALSALMEGLFKPLISELTSVGNRIGNWVGGLLSGKGGGFSLPGISLGGGKTGGGIGGINIGVGDIGKTIGGWLGLGGGSAIGIGGTATGAGLAGITAGAGATEAGFLAGMSGVSSTTGAAAGGSAFLSSLGAFASNPITIGVAGAAALGYLGYKWASGPDSYEAGSKEIMRDFGISVSDDQVKALFKAIGIDDGDAWDYRKELLSSPAAMATYLLAGKTPDLAKMANLQAYGAGHDFSGALQAAMGGDWKPYNEMYSSVFGMSELFRKHLSLSDVLIPGYAQGTNYVPKTGLALLHEGEAVIPANQNRPGPQIVINGPIYGFDDFKRRVAQAIKQAYNEGGLSYLRA